MRIKGIKAKKLICIMMIAPILAGMLTGCYDRREIDEMAYVMGIGLDKGKTNYLKMTFQIAKPQAGGGEGGGGGGGGDEKAMITTIESPTIYAGLNMVNTFVSRQVNLSHTKVIVFSKELAQEGIEAYLHALVRGREFRPNMYMVVSRGEAEEYMRGVNPQLDPSLAKYYELNFQAFRFTGFTANTQLHNFYNYSESLFRQPVATLAGVNKFESTEDFNLEKSTYKEKGRTHPLEGDFKAGDVTKAGGIKSEIMGLAVFDGSRMVGELDGEESTFYLMTSGEFNHCYVSISDPRVKDKFVLLNVKQSRHPRHKVQMNNGKPQIDVDVILEADILSIQSTISYEQGDNIKILETAAEEFFKEGINRYLNKTAKEFGADINGFGTHVKKNFLFWKDWEKYNWKSKYKDSSFKVGVDLKIRRPGLLVRTLPSVDTKGREEIK